MNQTQKGFVQLHLSVLLAGFTGLFGRLITLNEVDIVWSGVEEVLSALWLWGSVGVPLDTVLWFDQGFECLHRCHLLLADRILHGIVRASYL